MTCPRIRLNSLLQGLARLVRVPATATMPASSNKAWVVMPLYYYPLTETTWKPLYNAIAAHPDTNFLVVVNPNSGPGVLPLPGHDYIREIPRLNAFENVRTVGYVRIDYCRKPLRQSLAEIRQYADWEVGHNIPGLHVQGIYVDETPNHASTERAEYLDAVRLYIKHVNGLLGERTVVHNPGTPPEGDLSLFGYPDLVCISEEPHQLFAGEGVQKRLAELPLDRARSIYQLSGIPRQQIRDVVHELCKRGQYVFATDLQDDFYESFGPSWEDFISAVDQSDKI
ncbi:cell surface protein [Pestalotiopsis sp. NC0098]|nr:cell surface protein [Pestalotiopsis sp. NC0098]